MAIAYNAPNRTQSGRIGRTIGRQLDVMSEDSVNPATAATKAQRMLERGAVFHQGAAEPLLTNLDYRKEILWL